MTEDVEPNWEIRHGWHIVVDGMPTVRAHVAGWPPEGESNSEVLMSIAMVMTALPIVNAIPHVVRARPGWSPTRTSPSSPRLAESTRRPGPDTGLPTGRGMGRDRTNAPSVRQPGRVNEHDPDHRHQRLRLRSGGGHQATG